MNLVTYPLVSLSAAAAAASIVHFTPGPLPQNRLIVFTGLVAFAALALLVSAWRAGVALVGWCRGGKSVRAAEGTVSKAAANGVPRTSVSAETQTVGATPKPAPVSQAHANAQMTPPSQRTIATGITPGGILPNTQHLVQVFEATAKASGIHLSFAPKNFIKQEDPLAFNHQKDEAVVMGEVAQGQQKVHVLGESKGTWVLQDVVNKTSLKNKFQGAILGLASKEAKILTFFIPGTPSLLFPGAKPSDDTTKKAVQFALSLFKEPGIAEAFPTRRIFLEQPSS